MVAPVPAVRLDQVAREHIAGVEGDDGDLLFVHDGEDPAAGMVRADLEVVQATGSAERDRALRVGDVVAEAEVTPDARGPRSSGGCRDRPSRYSKPLRPPVKREV